MAITCAQQESSTQEHSSAPESRPCDVNGDVVTTSRAWGALSALLIALFMRLVDLSTVATAMPAITRGLHASLVGTMWVHTAYLLSYAIPLIISGRLGDRFGTRRIFVIGMLVFTFASLGSGLSINVGMLITFRVCQGLGSALMAPQSMTLITQLFPPQERGRALGLWSATSGAATLIGPILGGVCIDHFGWHAIFFINLPIAAIGLWQTMHAMPKLPHTTTRIDWVGVVLSGIAMTLIVFGIQEGRTYHWGVIRGVISVPLLIGLGVVTMIAFLLWQGHLGRTAGQPLIPLRLFRQHNFCLGILAVAFVGTYVPAVTLVPTMYLQQARGLTPTKASLLLIPASLFSVLLSPVAGRVVQRRSSGRVGAFGTGAVATVCLLWLALMTDATPLWVFLLVTTLMGVGSAFVWPPISWTTSHDLAHEDAGAGSSVYNTTRQIGQVIGSAIIATILDWRTSAAPNLARGFGQSMLVPMIGALIAFSATLFFNDYGRRAQ
ncbi:MAG: DHA2 family efflux MFS transporter permease subunit [Propionibacterium sp.]|jgi:drug resistance MFS transporter, drug:H+ antiporter-2 family|nr:DHA2 family efflux MFS transporter permease subunit [Propionibacterium sp.]